MRGKMREWWRKSKERGREAAKGRSVENCASAHVRLILWDDRGLTAQIKTTPCTVFQIFPSLIVLFPSLFPSLLFSPWWSLPPLPLPSPVLSRNSAQRLCLAPFACAFTAGCALQSNQSFAKDEKCTGGKLRSNSPQLRVCFFYLLLMQLSHINPSRITFSVIRAALANFAL